MRIIESPVKMRENLGPNRQRSTTKAIVIHNVGAPNATAGDMIYYMKSDRYKTFASYHYIIDLNGDVYQLFDNKETCYGSGSEDPTDLAIKEFGWPETWENTVDIEITHGYNYKITMKQELVLAELLAMLCGEFGLDPRINILRHGDLALDRYPTCPKYYFGDNFNFERLKVKTERAMRGI